jgi:hypothetical protein
MPTTIISNQTPFGGMTNRVTGGSLSLNNNINRLQEAIATASAGYEGVPGTEFEGPGNLFGVTPAPDTPGAQGTAYAYAVGELANHWTTFWTAALPYLKQLDNGTQTM